MSAAIELENDRLLPVPEESPSQPEPASPLDPTDATKQTTGAVIVGVSVALGVIANLLFYDKAAGINLSLYILLFTGATLGLLIFFQRPINFQNAIFALPTVVFGSLLSIHSADELVLFNLLLMLGALFLLIRFTSAPQFIGGHWLLPFLALLYAGLIGWFEGPVFVLFEGNKWLQRQSVNQRRATQLKAVLRGLMLTLPILVIFGLLLGTADMVFGDLLEDGLGWLNVDPASLIGQTFLIGFFTWIGLSAFKLAVFGSLADGLDKFLTDNSPEKIKNLFRLGMIETSMVLASVNAMFLLFVAVQAKYLFGGKTNISVESYTFSEYARRGFFEILAVSFLTMLLILVLDNFTQRRREKEYAFRGLSILLILLTLGLLGAAYRRLNLYEDAYGFTQLRVMSGVFMIWLGLLLAVTIYYIIRREGQIFWVSAIVAGCGFVLTLNAINMDSFIASRNIERYQEQNKLDVPYLLTLSDDAIPVIALLLDDTTLSSIQREELLNGLGMRLYNLDFDHEDRGWLEYHRGKDRAWKALDHYRDILKDYNRSSSQW